MKGKFIFGLPFLELEISGAKIQVLIDTGFNGELVLPQDTIEMLCLKKIGSAYYLSADGKGTLAETYEAEVDFLGKKKRADVVAGPLNFAIAGMALLHAYKISIERSKDAIEIEKSVLE